MMKSVWCLLTAVLASVAALTVQIDGAHAQTTARVRGVIMAVDGDRLTVKALNDEQLTIQIVEPATLSARVRVDPSRITPGAYVGAAAVPAANDLAGVEIFIFPEAARGAGEGHRPMDLLPDSTMTNATVTSQSTGASGPVLTLSYKGGEKTLLITPQTRVFAPGAASRSDLKPGATLSVTIEKDAAGGLITKRLTVDKDGV